MFVRDVWRLAVRVAEEIRGRRIAHPPKTNGLHLCSEGITTQHGRGNPPHLVREEPLPQLLRAAGAAPSCPPSLPFWELFSFRRVFDEVVRFSVCVHSEGCSTKLFVLYTPFCPILFFDLAR